MSRRKSDKVRDRVLILLAILVVASTSLACIVSYKALGAMARFNMFIEAAAQIGSRNNLAPESY